MNKKSKFFGVFTAFYYFVQLLFCMGAGIYYSDRSRFHCVLYSYDIHKASEVYDLAIFYTGVFHIIEWIRTTILLVVICAGTNCLMYVWYLSAISTLYGVGVFVYVHIVYFSADGQACSSD